MIKIRDVMRSMPASAATTAWDEAYRKGVRESHDLIDDGRAAEFLQTYGR